MSNPFAPHVLDEAATEIAVAKVQAANPWLTVRVARDLTEFDDVLYEDGALVLPVAVFVGPKVEMTWLDGIRLGLGDGEPIVTDEGDVLAVTGA